MNAVVKTIQAGLEREPAVNVHQDDIRVVTSEQGIVPSVNHRQLAEVMAWWTPGITGVVNELQVDPPQEDDDGEVLDALNPVLDRDPALQHDEIQLMVRQGEVTMGGVAFSAEQKERAERNCWYLPGVRNVINKLDIAP